MPESLSVSKEIAAAPERVIALVSDVTRVGEWSPETTSCVWTSGYDGPAVGAVFKGVNRNGPRRWTTTCKVTAADATHFGFHVTYLGIDIADWDYVATPGADGGCTVTETWTDRRKPILTGLGAIATGVRDRAAHNRAGMEQTLAALAAAAERPA